MITYIKCDDFLCLTRHSWKYYTLFSKTKNSSSLPFCSKLLLLSILGYMMLLLSSSLQLSCPSSGHQGRPMLVFGFLRTLPYMCVFEDNCLSYVDFLQDFLHLSLIFQSLDLHFLTHFVTCGYVFPSSCHTYFHLILLFPSTQRKSMLLCLQQLNQR